MRARNVQRDFWLDERAARLSPVERLIWLGLNAAADREGRLEYRPLRLRVKMFPYDSEGIDLESAVQALESAGVLVRYEVEGQQLAYLPDFCKTQRFHPREAPSRLPAPPCMASAPAYCREADLGQTVVEPIASQCSTKDQPSLGHGLTKVPGIGSPGSITVDAPEGATMDSPGASLAERELPAEAVRLAELLGELMRQNDPLAKVPKNLRRWAQQLEQLHRIDGRSWEDIERIMRWSQKIPFWQAVILSPSNLRKQFPRILLQVKNTSGGDAWQDAREVVP